MQNWWIKSSKDLDKIGYFLARVILVLFVSGKSEHCLSSNYFHFPKLYRYQWRVV